MIVIYNVPGVIILTLAFALTAAISGPLGLSSFAATLIGSVLIVAGDVAYRVLRCRRVVSPGISLRQLVSAVGGQIFFRPGLGGQFFYIPLWVWGVVISVGSFFHVDRYL